MKSLYLAAVALAAVLALPVMAQTAPTETDMQILAQKVKADKKLLVASDGKFAIVEVAASQKLDKTLATAGLTLMVDPKAEWQQLFNDAWRLERDFFYDPHMHGLDWAAVKTSYQKLIDASVTLSAVALTSSDCSPGQCCATAGYSGSDPGTRPARMSVSCWTSAPVITSSPVSSFLRSRLTSSARRMSIFPCRMRRR